MARRKLGERHIRKLTRTGGSMTVSPPIDWVRELKWRERQKLVVKKVGRRLIIEDWPVSPKRKRTGGSK